MTRKGINRFALWLVLGSLVIGMLHALRAGYLANGVTDVIICAVAYGLAVAVSLSFFVLWVVGAVTVHRVLKGRG